MRKHRWREECNKQKARAEQAERERDQWMDRATTIQAECDELREKNAYLSRRCSVLTDERDKARSLLQPYQHALPIAREERDRLEATLDAVREWAEPVSPPPCDMFYGGVEGAKEQVRRILDTTTQPPAPEEDSATVARFERDSLREVADRYHRLVAEANDCTSVHHCGVCLALRGEDDD